MKNEENPLRHFRAMDILIKKLFELFVSDDADWGYCARHGHAFFNTLCTEKNMLLNQKHFFPKARILLIHKNILQEPINMLLIL